jgi:hypothetical protein
LVPLDTSALSPIYKLIAVDLWSNKKKVVEQALTQLADLCFKNEIVKENRITAHGIGGASSMVYRSGNPQVQFANATMESNAYRRLAKE